MLPMQGLLAGVNSVVASSAKAFGDKELDQGLKYLDEVACKIMIYEGNVHLV